MRRMLLICCFGLLTGCADTPQNRALWEGIGSGMQSAGDAMNQQTQLLNQRMHEQSLQRSQQNVYQAPRPTNCITTYSQLFKAYETTCN